MKRRPGFRVQVRRWPLILKLAKTDLKLGLPTFQIRHEVFQLLRGMKSARVLPGDQTIIELELERFNGIRTRAPTSYCRAVRWWATTRSSTKTGSPSAQSDIRC